MKNRELVPLSEYECRFVNDMDADKENFCYQYATDLNPQLAAERCGITVRKARKWLKDPMVKKAVSDIKARVAAHCELKIEEVLNELKRSAFFDIKGVVDSIDKKGNVSGVNWDDVDGRAIAEVKVTETKTGKIITMIKPHRKTEALKTLLDYLSGANSNQVNVQINVADIKKEDPEAAMDVYMKLMEGGTIENAQSQG